MKKTVFGLMVLAVCMSLCSCGEKKEETKKEEAKPEVKIAGFCNSDDDIIDRFLKNLK